MAIYTALRNFKFTPHPRQKVKTVKKGEAVDITNHPEQPDLENKMLEFGYVTIPPKKTETKQ